MLGNLWIESFFASEELGVSEVELSTLREIGFLKPGIHWRSSPKGQLKPWNPKAIYNLELCKIAIKEFDENFDRKVA